MRAKPLMIFAGQFWPGATASGMARGFKEEGWLVQEIDIRQFVGQSGPELSSKIAHRLLRKSSVSRYHGRILGDCEALQPDLFFTVKGADLTANLLYKIRKLGIATANFYPDMDFAHKNTEQDSLNEYDWFFTSKEFQVKSVGEQIGADRVVHIPHGFVGGTHMPLSNDMRSGDYLADVGFAASHSGYKQAFLEQLLRELPNLDLLITGPNWEKHISNSPLKRCYETHNRFGFAFSDFLQRSRINLALLHGKAKTGVQDTVSTRTFEIPACQGFMLHIDNSEVRKYYDVGSEIDVFKTPKQLAEKIQFYLQHSDKRTEMLNRAYHRAIRDHSCTNRVQTMLNYINGNSRITSEQTMAPRD